MSIKNLYPQFPEVPYKKTSVDMSVIVLLAKSLLGKYSLEVIRTAYCIFRNESSNGQSGVNENYIGLQADNSVWQGLELADIIGTCIRVDGAGETRRFICFNENGYKVSFEFLCKKVNQRGMYIGAAGVTDSDDLAAIYQEKWVSNPVEDTPEAREDFKSLYNSSKIAIS